MPKMLQVRNVPDDVHRTLKARAAQEGRTLSEYVRDELQRMAARPTMAELIARIESREPVELSEPIADIVRKMRDDDA